MRSCSPLPYSETDSERIRDKIFNLEVWGDVWLVLGAVVGSLLVCICERDQSRLRETVSHERYTERNSRSPCHKSTTSVVNNRCVLRVEA